MYNRDWHPIHPGIFISGRNPFHDPTPPPSSAPAEWSEWWLLCVCGWHRHRGPVFHPLHRIALHLWAPPFTTVTFAFCPQWALYAQHCWRQRGAAYRLTEELKMPLQRCLATRLYATLLWFQSALMGKLVLIPDWYAQNEALLFFRTSTLQTEKTNKQYWSIR